MMFWLVIGAMCAAALAGLLLPLFRTRYRDDVSSAEADHLRRLAEFDADVAAGDIDKASAADVRAELERAVLDGVSRTAAQPGVRSGQWLPLGLMLLCPALAVLLYLEIGRPEIGVYLAENPQKSLSQPIDAIDFLLTRLRREIADDPDNTEALTVLARTEQQLGNFTAAEAAAAQLVALRPDDPAALVLLIDTRAMQAEGQLDNASIALVDRLLELDPDNVNGLILRGMVHMQRGERDGALAAFRRALPLLPADAPLRTELAPLLAGDTDVPAPAAAVQIDVTVAIDPALGAALPGAITPDTPVFVLARMADGPPAPLAVVRRRFADLPLTVALTEQMAMMPGHSLAAADAVEIVARVALSGRPLPAPGDLEGKSPVLIPAPRLATRILIDTVVTAPAAGPAQ